MHYNQIVEKYGDKALPLELIPLVELDAGGHVHRSNGCCVMELVAWIAGEPQSYRPQCASPVLASIAAQINDLGGPALRQKLKDYAPRLANSRDMALEASRAFSLVQSVVANLNELATRVTAEEERKDLMPAVEALNRMMRQVAAKEITIEDAFGVIDESEEGLSYRLDASDAFDLAYDTIVDLRDMMYPVDDALKGAISHPITEEIVIALKRMDSFFDTGWALDPDSDPKKPQPGARAFAAFEKALSITQAII